jgi:hypothetical protein
VLALRDDALAQVLNATSGAGSRAAGSRGKELEALANQLRKVVPRKWRRAYELASVHYASAPLEDIARWRRAILRTANRASALITDDLAAAVRALSLVAETSAPTRARPQADPADVADLLRFWMSEAAFRVRARTRLVPPRARTVV